MLNQSDSSCWFLNISCPKCLTFVFQNLQSVTVTGFFSQERAETVSVFYCFHRFNMLLLWCMFLKRKSHLNA